MPDASEPTVDRAWPIWSRTKSRFRRSGTSSRSAAGRTSMRRYHDNRRTRRVRPFVMDQPILHPFVAEFRGSDRLRGFAEAFPAAARVSEPALPLLLAALHEELGRPLVLLAPEDADARDAAEAAAWFLGDERVALLPSRGVHWGSGLDPAPHLVGERARALDVLAAGGLVAASAAALAEPMPSPNARPQPIRIAPGEGISLEQLSETLALAGYERVERADERGQFAVRGGLVDVFPTTGREPLRIEFWGDEIEQMRAFSPFPQRALTRSLRADPRRRGPADPDPDRSRASRSRRPRPRVACRRSPHGLGGGGPRAGAVREGGAAGHAAGRSAVRLRGAAAGSRSARPLGSGERAGRIRPLGTARRRRVPTPRRGHAAAKPSASHRSACHRRGRRAAARSGAHLRHHARATWVRLARPRPRLAARHAGLPQAAAPRAARRRAGAAVVRGPAQRRLHRPRGPRRREAARLRNEGGRGRYTRLSLPRLPRR